MERDLGRRGLTNGLGARRPPPREGRVNGIRGATNGLVNGTRGRTNGLTNGMVNGTRGRTNGLVNGTRGRTNGIVNGRGAVNGSGFVNGLPLRRNPFGIVTHRDLRRSGALLAASVVLILVVGYILSMPVPTGPVFAVDGDFREWTTLYPDDVDAPPAADLVSFGVHVTDDRVFAYGKTTGTLFAGPEPSSVYLLVAVGNEPGYEASPGFAARFVAEAFGWDGALQGTSLRAWAGAPDADNATALDRLGGFPANATEREFELALDASDLGLDPQADVWFRIATRAGGGTDDSAIVGRGLGALLVDQEPLAETITSASPVLRLTFRALATGIRVDDILLTQSGGGQVVRPDLPFVVAAGSTYEANLTLDPGALPSGSFLAVGVRDVDATAVATGTRVRSVVSGSGARMYVGAAPAGYAVDGLFGDWTNLTSDPDDTVPDGIDVRKSAAAVQTGAFFYVETDGDVMAGALLPMRPSRPAPGNGTVPPGPPAPLRRVAGEDLLRIYVDTDDRFAVGEPFGSLLADRLLEVRGRLGRITARTLYAWNSSLPGWEPSVSSFDVAFVGSQLEAFAPPAFLGPTNNASVAFAMSDWSGASDETGVLGLRGTRGGPSLRPWHGNAPLTAVVPPLTNVPLIDGDCATPPGVEYDGANSYGTADFTFRIGRRSDLQFAFVCVTVDADTTSNALDWGELLFDTGHGGGNTPQDDDRRFRIYSSLTPLSPEKGDGTTWVACGTSCDGGDVARGAYTNGIEVYEFRIRFSDVWGTNSPTPNQRAGFAVVVHDEDGPVDYAWGNDSVDEMDPATWGHVDIPEFPGLLVVGAVLPVLLWIDRRRRRRFPPANP